MQFKQLLYIFLLIPFYVYASYTPYCKGVKVSNAEDAVIQRLVPRFGIAYGCEIGGNCLLKWDVKKNSEKFSIAWKNRCGPVINGIYQFGDKGLGSTFECKIKNPNSVCCWPEGYERLKQFNLCSDDIFKKK